MKEITSLVNAFSPREHVLPELQQDIDALAKPIDEIADYLKAWDGGERSVYMYAPEGEIELLRQQRSALWALREVMFKRLTFWAECDLEKEMGNQRRREP